MTPQAIAAEVLAARIRTRRTLASFMRDARRSRPACARGARGRDLLARLRRGSESHAGGATDWRPVRPDRLRREARTLGRWAAEPLHAGYSCGRSDAEGDAKNAAADLARLLRLAARMLETP